MVVLVLRIWFFRVDVASSIRGIIGAKRARSRRGNTFGPAIACEVALLEDLDQCMLSVALDGASVADASGCPDSLVFIFRGRIASQACENILSKRAKDFRTAVNALDGQLALGFREGLIRRRVYIW